jgi:hypothetical protein
MSRGVGIMEGESKIPLSRHSCTYPVPRDSISMTLLQVRHGKQAARSRGRGGPEGGQPVSHRDREMLHITRSLHTALPSESFDSPHGSPSARS